MHVYLHNDCAHIFVKQKKIVMSVLVLCWLFWLTLLVSDSWMERLVNLLIISSHIELVAFLGDDWWLRWSSVSGIFFYLTGPDYYLQNFVFRPFGCWSLVTLPTHIWPVHLQPPRLVTPSSCWSSQHFWVDLGNRCSFLKIRETTKIWFSFVNCALFAKPPTNSVGFGNQALFCANFLRFLNSSFLHFDRRPSISTHALFYATQGINRSTKSIRSFEWRNLTSCHLVLWLLIKLVLRLADGNLVQFWQIPTPTQKLHVTRASSARLNRLI